MKRLILALGTLCGAMLLLLTLQSACGTDLLPENCTVATEAVDCFDGWGCDLASGGVCRRKCDAAACPTSYECDSNDFCQHVVLGGDDFSGDTFTGDSATE